MNARRPSKWRFPEVASDWDRLGAPTVEPGVFDPASASHLPEPVRRWLGRAIAPGTPLKTSAEIRMHGSIRLGDWRTFQAVQRLTPSDGFVWSATANLFGMPVVGFDRYTRGSGQMRWLLLNLFPVMRGSGVDVSRSSAGRHVGELLTFVPAAALDRAVSWSRDGGERATAHLRVGSWSFDVTVTVDESGALRELVMRRWGSIGGQPFAEYVFGASFEGEVSGNGFTVPSRVTAGWHHGTDRWGEGQFIRYEIDSIVYR